MPFLLEFAINLIDGGAIKSVNFQPVARMSEAKYEKTMMSSIVPAFRFAHTGYLATWPARRRRKPTLSIAPY
ncbi:hypothetical protein CbuD7D7780_06750 [Coxiella burnetii]|nr:hypothetical protein CbuD7E6568_06720 [Coxiella burnetii]OYK82157.1 hypothetical protein CbuD7D7780_06750 [Coxiella burnetii]